MYDRKAFAATPIGADGHLDVPLSNVAVRGFNDGTDGLIGNSIFPEVPVGKQSDKYYIIDKAAFLRIPDALRAPKTQARNVEFRVSSESYFADNYALAAENALEDLANADNAIKLRENSTILVTGNLRRGAEERVANLITSASNLGSGVALTGANKWSDFVGSDPIADVNTGHATIRQNTGLRANTMIIDFDTIMVIRRHPKILDMFKYTSGGEVTDQALKDVFKVERILVGDGVKENQLEGDAASSMTNIWGNNAVLARIGPPRSAGKVN